MKQAKSNARADLKAERVRHWSALHQLPLAAEDAARKAMAAVRSRSELLGPIKNEALLARDLVPIAQRYFELKTATILADMEQDVEPLEGIASKADTLAGELQKLASFWAGSLRRKGVDPTALAKALDNLNDSCSALKKGHEFLSTESHRRYRTGPRQQAQIVETVKCLAALWPKVSGQGFSHNFNIAKGAPNVDEFVSPGPLFVQIVLQVFDPKLPVKKIRSALSTLRK